MNKQFKQITGKTDALRSRCAFTLIELIVGITIVLILLTTIISISRPIVLFIRDSFDTYQVNSQINNIQELIREDVEESNALVGGGNVLGLLKSGAIITYRKEGSDLVRKIDQNIKLNTPLIEFLEFFSSINGQVVNIHYKYRINGRKVVVLEDAYYAWNVQ